MKSERSKRTSDKDIKIKLICKYGVDKESQTVDELIAEPKQQCAKFIIPSKTSELIAWLVIAIFIGQVNVKLHELNYQYFF